MKSSPELIKHRMQWFLATWPAGVPAEMAGLPAREGAEIIQRLSIYAEMPDAELPRSIVPMVHALRAAITEADAQILTFANYVKTLIDADPDFLSHTSFYTNVPEPAIRAALAFAA